MKRIVYMFIMNCYKLPYLLFCLFHYARPEKYPPEKRYGFLHRFCKGVNRNANVKIVCTGKENLPQESGYIMFPNHQGFFDSLAFFETHDRPFTAVMKKETQDVKLLKKVSHLIDAEIIDREDIRQSMQVIKNVSERVKKGEIFLIFAEGTRSKLGNKLLDFKGGSFKSAMYAHCPIVPVALFDSFKAFDTNSIRRITVQIHYLKPLYYEDYKDMKSTEIAKLVHDTIQQKIDDVISEEG